MMVTYARNEPLRKLQPPGPASKSFEFPINQHLLITTPSYIFAWDTLGIKTIFSSSKGGIVAAKEAKDGSGVLAVADRHVVVLQDTKRGQERSWGLGADGDEVRQLEYTADSKDLYLTTRLAGSVQRYSTEHARLFNPSNIHSSSPTAMAISPTGHLLLSASEDPPSIYIKNLAHNSAPVLLEPRASDAAVCVASFHPERANIFLLGFANGTIAAYDATRIMKRQHGKYANQEHANWGEIARFTEMHRPTSKGRTGSQSATVTGAAFLPGYKTRAISVGSDGRCRLVDFADGGITLRTWHAKAPLTSVSVVAVKEDVKKPVADRQSARASRRPPGAGLNVMGGPTSTNNLIAVGRADGKVSLYDSLGILITQKRVSVQGERIISVEWAKGPAPSPIAPRLDGRDPSDPLSASLPSLASQTTPRRASHPSPGSRRRQSTLAPGLGLPTSLRRSAPALSPTLPTSGATRRFTIHPDEREEVEAEGTVRRVPSPRRPHAAAAGIGGGQFNDLFSPVKVQPSDVPSPKPRRTSSTKTRPRVSTSTFKRDQTAFTEPPIAFSSKLKLPLDPATTEGYQVSTEGSPRAKPVRRISKGVSPLNTKRRRSSAKPGLYSSGINPAIGTSAAPLASNNATILANLRQLNNSTNQHVRQPSAPLFARKPVPHNNHTTVGHPYETQRATPPKKNKRASGYRLRRIHWQTDSVQDSITGADEDIWLTSQSEREMRPRGTRTRRPPHEERPPARQTSRSKVDANGTVSTVATVVPERTAPHPPVMTATILSSDEMHTARSNLSTAQQDFSPSAREIQTLFPRSSSLSPKRKPLSPNKPAPDRTALAEISANPVLQPPASPPKPADTAATTLVAGAKSPWTRAAAAAAATRRPSEPPQPLSKAPVSDEPDAIFSRQTSAHTVRISRPAQHVSPAGEDEGTDATATTVESHCQACSRTRDKMRSLQEEVARMRAEMLVLRQAVRLGREGG